jgi:hypothetical protein
MPSDYNLRSWMVFESSASEGAVLAMPQGAQAQDVANVSIFRKYLSRNADNWYRYVNNLRGREARNGDVRLVIGCDKASSWGVAAFSNLTERNCSLKFRTSSETESGHKYVWDCSGMVEARAGPDPQETGMLAVQSGALLNQCLFVRTLDATLGDDTWHKLGFHFEVRRSSIPFQPRNNVGL